jgi:hypothetical protein
MSIDEKRLLKNVDLGIDVAVLTYSVLDIITPEG